jgi:hypothetical protein
VMTLPTGPTIIGLYVGILLGAVHLIICVIRKTAPDFIRFILVVLSVVATIVSVHSAYVILTVTDEQLGLFQDQRLQMALGALAIIWVSVHEFIKINMATLNLKAVSREPPSEQVEEERNRESL